MRCSECRRLERDCICHKVDPKVPRADLINAIREQIAQDPGVFANNAKMRCVARKLECSFLPSCKCPMCVVDGPIGAQPRFNVENKDWVPWTEANDPTTVRLKCCGRKMGWCICGI